MNNSGRKPLRRGSWVRQRAELGIAVGVVMFLVLLRSTGVGYNFIGKLELSTEDLRYELRGKLPVDPREIVIVGIDEPSLNVRPWPWHRSVFATMVKNLHHGGAKAILFDILFSEPREGDADFAAAMRAAGNVFLSVHYDNSATVVQPASPALLRFGYPAVLQSLSWEYARLVPPIAMLANAAAGCGHVIIGADQDGTYRRAILFVDMPRAKAGAPPLVIPHAALDLVRFVRGVDRRTVSPVPLGGIQLGTSRIGCDGHGRLLMNFPGPRGTFPHISAQSVIDGTVNPARIKGAIVLVGATAAGLSDIRPSPFDPVYFGVETNATLVWNLLHGNYLLEASVLAHNLTVVLFGLMIAGLVPRLRPGQGAIVAFVFVAGYAVLAQVLFVIDNIMIDVVSPALSIFLTYGLITAYRLTTEEREKRRLRETFSLYVQDSVVEELMRHRESLQLGGVRREVTILFADIRGFTSMSERMEPGDVVELLNEYFTAMNEIVFAHGGTVDKYIGDSIMVIFNAPLDLPDHPLQALRSALAMRAKLRRLQDKWTAEGKPGFMIGVGVHTGMPVVGNVGSQRRMNYTVIGDDVNLAFRLEALNRQYGTEILISEATYTRCASAIEARFLDTVTVKGKSEPVGVYELLALKHFGGLH